MRSAVTAWFESRTNVPLMPPPGFGEWAPESDDGEPFDADFSRRDIAGLAFGMEYRDETGEASARTIRCLAIDPFGPGYIRAYCHYRRDRRTFRMDGIRSIVSLRSGRILSPEAAGLLLAPYELPESLPVSQRLLAAVVAAVKPGVSILLGLGMPDGRLHDEPRRAVLAYVMAEARALSLTLPHMEGIELFLDNLSPPHTAVAEASDAMLADREKIARLLPYVMEIAKLTPHRNPRDAIVAALITAVRDHFRMGAKPLPFDFVAQR
jgi:hypothetical protein